MSYFFHAKYKTMYWKFYWTCSLIISFLNNIVENNAISPRSVFGVSSQRFRRLDTIFSCEGVSLPGVTAPGVACAGVASHILVLTPGVAPGVSPPLP